MPSLSKLLSRKLNIFLLRTSNNEYKKSLEKIDKCRKMVSTDEAARDGLKKVLEHLESISLALLESKRSVRIWYWVKFMSGKSPESILSFIIGSYFNFFAI